jgi:phosphohistidine swiveling domain-containing protein
MKTLASIRHDISTGAFLCPLEDAHHSDGVGGKAANLGEMLNQSVSVPPGFVVTDTAFQYFLDQNALRSPIENALAGLEPEFASVNAASEAIRQRVLAAEIPATVLEHIRDMLALKLPGAPLAVRSSAIGEDSRQAAFAGQLDSFLNVKDGDSLSKSLLACWASYWSPRVLFYQLSKGIRLKGMGVVIQELVHSNASGILFTRNPDPSIGRTDALVLEYCPGFGDRLASGDLNPGRMIIDRNDFRWHEQSTPEQLSDGGPIRHFVTQKIERLATTALKLEQHFGCPQDIEFTINDAGELYIVQTRPITVGCMDKPTGEQAQDQQASSTNVLWSNANVNENYPEPISPLLYSIASAGYYHYFRNLALTLGFDRQRVASMEHPLRNVIGVHGARMYYNLTNIHSLIRMAPCGETLAQWFDDFVGIDHPASEENETLFKKIKTSWLSRTIELCRTAVKSSWQFLFLTKRVAKFERVVDEFAASVEPDVLASMPLHRLLDRFRGFSHIRNHQWTDASLADMAAMVSYGLLKRLLQGEFQDADQAGMHNSLLKGLRDVVSGQPIIELWHLSRIITKSPELRSLLASGADKRILATIRDNPKYADFLEAFERFVSQWGFRCSGELMLTVPSFQEQPESVLEILRAYADLPDDAPPMEQLRRQATDRESETACVVAELKQRKIVWGLPWPTKATLLKIALKGCHRSIALRERARLKQALLYSCFRRVALAIGSQMVTNGMLSDRNHIFFFTYQEIDALLAGSAMFPHQTKELAELRKSGHLQLANMHPLDVFVLPRGMYLPTEPSNPIEPMSKDGTDANAELVGVGACGGRVTAPAAILQDISECRKLNQGDVLVTRQTDPGWGPVFFLIKGLVMERGGMLSHGAILAREYGIPTVVGVHHATTQIRMGQRIEVNGDRGVVQLID